MRSLLRTIFHTADTKLLHEARRGNAKSFEKLYLKYLDSLYRYIFFRVGQRREVAEDLTQTVFMKAWRNINSYKDGNPKAWLFRIAHNQVIDYYREKKPLPLTVDVPDERIDGEDILQQDFLKIEVAKALNELPDEQQQVIILKHIEEMSYSDIARVIDKNEAAVRQINSRALKRLRTILTVSSPYEGEDKGGVGANL
ncbi:sigma-70 family RNA polymerase sigma factor [Candidatus Microgenomates bacterium]|nr:MAG: sigma-70 family RNA polymerase sigma factor [Candidatus Microgenomates bacterium]